MADIKDINNRLKNIVKIAGFDSVVLKTNVTASNIKALEATSLGELLNENISGVQGLTVNAGSSNIALLQNNLTGLESQIVKDVSSSKSDLQSITGATDTVENGFLDLVFTAASAEGVKAGINVVATPTDSQMQTILTNIVPEQFSSQVSSIVGQDFTSLTANLSVDITAFNSAFTNLLNGKTGNILQDVLLQTDTSPISAIVALGVTPSVASDVLLLLQTNKFDDAVATVSATPGVTLSQAQIETALLAVPIDISSQITTPGVRSSSLAVFDPTTNFNNWTGKNTPKSYFSLIATLEELMIELVNTSREITEVVFCGYEIDEDQSVTPQDIHEACIAAGLDGIAYHYVILPNGDMRRGRSLAVDGEYNTAHNQYSIIVVVPHKRNVGATIAQGRSIDLFLEAFWNLWPGGQCWDAEDIDVQSFPVGVNIDNYRSNYRKQNFGNAGRSYSTTQLISAAKGNL